MNQQSRGYFSRYRSIAFIVIAGFLIVGVSQAAMTPTERVREAITGILSVLKNKNLDREAKWSEVGRIIDDGFDFRSMSQSVLATNWRTATAEEKRQFVE